jgi:glycyl-tRNA synthetase alpha subunit
MLVIYIGFWEHGYRYDHSDWEIPSMSSEAVIFEIGLEGLEEKQ